MLKRQIYKYIASFIAVFVICLGVSILANSDVFFSKEEVLNGTADKWFYEQYGYPHDPSYGFYDENGNLISSDNN